MSLFRNPEWENEVIEWINHFNTQVRSISNRLEALESSTQVLKQSQPAQALEPEINALKCSVTVLEKRIPKQIDTLREESYQLKGLHLDLIEQLKQTQDAHRENKERLSDLSQSVAQYDLAFREKSEEIQARFEAEQIEITRLHNLYCNEVQENRKQLMEITSLNDMEKATELFNIVTSDQSFNADTAERYVLAIIEANKARPEIKKAAIKVLQELNLIRVSSQMQQDHSKKGMFNAILNLKLTLAIGEEIPNEGGIIPLGQSNLKAGSTQKNKASHNIGDIIHESEPEAAQTENYERQNQEDIPDDYK